jgi:hypothetical protein
MKVPNAEAAVRPERLAASAENLRQSKVESRRSQIRSQTQTIAWAVVFLRLGFPYFIASEGFWK